MHIDNLENFLAIVKYKSISEAAKHLCIDPSALAKQLKKLEGNDGPYFTRILVGHNTVFELTPAGKIFAQYAEAVLKNGSDMRNNMDTLHKK